jgi:hypothetical protein
VSTYRTVQLIILGVLVVMFGLSALARRFPQVDWLQLFRFDRPRLSEQEKARIRRRSNIQAGIELLLLGIVLPLGYIAITVMFFSAFETIVTALVFAGSILCIGLGLMAIWRNR